MTIKTESPKSDRAYAAERIAMLCSHGMSDKEILAQTMFEIDPLTLIGVIRDLLTNKNNPEPAFGRK